MSVYVAEEWVDDVPEVVDGTDVTAARMNHLEEGVEDASNHHHFGLLADRPAAAAGNAGWLYFASDVDGGTIFHSDGDTWESWTAGVAHTHDRTDLPAEIAYEDEANTFAVNGTYEFVVDPGGADGDYVAYRRTDGLKGMFLGFTGGLPVVDVYDSTIGESYITREALTINRFSDSQTANYYVDRQIQVRRIAAVADPGADRVVLHPKTVGARVKYHTRDSTGTLRLLDEDDSASFATASHSHLEADLPAEIAYEDEANTFSVFPQSFDMGVTECVISVDDLLLHAKDDTYGAELNLASGKGYLNVYDNTYFAQFLPRYLQQSLVADADVATPPAGSMRMFAKTVSGRARVRIRDATGLKDVLDSGDLGVSMPSIAEVIARSPYAQAVLGDTPLVYLPADRDLLDYSGAVRDGTAQGGAVLTANGPMPGAFDFAASLDGVNDYVSLVWPTRVDWCTNPVAGVDTAGWTNVGLATFERVTSLPTTTGLPSGVTTGFHCIGDSGSDRVQMAFNAESGKTYTFSIYIRLVSRTATSVRLQASGTSLGSVNGGQATVIGGDFARITVTFTATATESVQCRIVQNGAGAVEWHHSAVMIEEAAAVGTFFLPGRTGDEDTVWSGTAHASTSVKGAWVPAEWTREIWINPTNLSANRPILGGDKAASPKLELRTDGSIRFYPQGNSTGNYRSWAAGIAAGGNYHVAFTYSPATGAGNLWVNQTAVGAGSATGSPAALATDPGTLWIGAHQDATYFLGALSHFAAYNAARSSAEMTARYSIMLGDFQTA